MKILVTGSAGFIGGYLVEELLNAGHVVVGIDNFEKYGPVEKSYDHHPNYHFTQGDAKDADLLRRLIAGCDHVVALAAKIGGISYFHALAYDLIAENERISAATFDAALAAFRAGSLKKVTVLSSSMVFENANEWPTAEYTIVRPFNCAGIGERRAKTDVEVNSGNIKLAMSHVIPDLVQKVLKGQDPLHILGSGSQVRCYTYGGDLARGIRLAIERPEALNQDFNLSTAEATDVLTLARMVWEKINRGKPFHYVSDKPFAYDVQKRIPSVEKAKRLLGFEATTPLSAILDEVIPWLKEEIAAGRS